MPGPSHSTTQCRLSFSIGKLHSQLASLLFPTVLNLHNIPYRAMPFEVLNPSIYPNCRSKRRVVTLGGLKKSELIEELARNAISMNGSAERLFANDHFTTSEIRYSLTTIELTACNLGFPQGATIADIYERARQLGLGLCPLELGPHLRLQYLDQSEGCWGKPDRRHQAPYGSIMIASEPLTEDDDFPKGFYLRRIKGLLWLRGYRSRPQHVWEADDHFAFVEDKT